MWNRFVKESDENQLLSGKVSEDLLHLVFTSILYVNNCLCKFFKRYFYVIFFTLQFLVSSFLLKVLFKFFVIITSLFHFS
jgi:hypothetical protein